MPQINIPEINKNQLEILKGIGEIHGTSMVSLWIIPDPLKDNPEEFIRLSRSKDDIDKLIDLGLLIDTSAEESNAETIKNVRVTTNRVLRAISVTGMGLLMFGHVTGTESQKVN